jgi:hypothetical protein
LLVGGGALGGFAEAAGGAGRATRCAEAVVGGLPSMEGAPGGFGIGATTEAGESARGEIERTAGPPSVSGIALAGADGRAATCALGALPGSCPRRIMSATTGTAASPTTVTAIRIQRGRRWVADCETKLVPAVVDGAARVPAGVALSARPALPVELP